MHVHMMRVHMMHVQCIYQWSNLTLVHVCMMHMSLMRMNACIHVWCINLWCRVFSLQTNGQINKPIIGVHRDVCVYDAYIYDPIGSLILTCVYDACINVCKLWCIYLLSLILIHDMMCTHVCTMYTCVYDVHIWCAYGVYGTHIYDPGLWSWYMHVWCAYLRSLILIHVCIMQVCMMNFDPQSLALMHVWCMNV